MKNWQEFWEHFDRLVDSLKMTNQTNCVTELKDAQTYVNGFTDGWFEFLEAFEKSINDYRDQLSKDQIHQADFLTSTLRNSLTQR